MQRELLHRLSKLHDDAPCCVTELRQQREELIDSDGFPELLVPLQSLADEHRLAMTMLVRRYGELCQCEIEAAFDLSHSTINHHLTMLVEGGVLETTRRGKWTYYRIAKNFATTVKQLTDAFRSRRPTLTCCCC